MRYFSQGFKLKPGSATAARDELAAFKRRDRAAGPQEKGLFTYEVPVETLLNAAPRIARLFAQVRARRVAQT
jgi:hypothetical protein